MTDWNSAIIDEFRGNNGVVQQFAPAYLVLLHHVGRKSGSEYVSPVVYFPADGGTIHVVASAAGRPDNPQWYRNMVEAGRVRLEVGSPAGIETYEATVEDLAGDERDRVFTDIKKQAPGFGDYEQKTEGIRTIPVLALHRT